MSISNASAKVSAQRRNDRSTQADSSQRRSDSNCRPADKNRAKTNGPAKAGTKDDAVPDERATSVDQTSPREQNQQSPQELLEQLYADYWTL